MRKPDQAIRRAEKLRAVINMPEYSQTIGAWLNEAHQAALHGLTTAKEIHEFHQAQGAYAAMQSIRDQFESVWASEKVAVSKNAKERIET